MIQGLDRSDWAAMESEKYCFNAAKYIGEGCTGEQKMENDILEIYLGATEYFECHVNGF